MASRSMNYLRKNAKVVLVVMGIVCMITFVVGSALTDWATRANQAAANPNPVVVSWSKGKVHSTELQNLRYRHAKAYQFLATVIQTALQRGGKPMVNGRPVSMDRMQNFDVGIPMDNSEESAVQTMVLATEADRLGVVVDQEAVKSYLRQISSPELREGDWADIARQVVGEDNHMDVNQLLEYVGYELKAQRVRMLALSGMYAQGVGPIVPPGQAFELFNRLNRRFAIEAYPVETSNFISQVKEEPTAKELQALFDEGKNRDPNPNLDEPGFRKPLKFAFKWLPVSFTPFLDEAKKQITEEQIQQAYEQDISQGLHKALELPPATKEEGDKPQSDQPGTEPGEKPADGAKPANGEKPAGSEKPAADAKPEQTTKPQTEKPSEAGNSEPAAPADAPQPDAKPAGKTADAPSGCGSEDEQPENAADKQEIPPAAPAQPAASDQPAPTLTPAETNPAASPPAEKPTEGTAEAPAAPATPGEPAPPKEQKFKPLSEVHDEIQTRLAQPIAEEARKKAVGEITAAIEKYGKDYRRYESIKTVAKTVAKNAEVKDPGKLDIVPLATKYGFPIGESPLVDRYDIAKYEIGQKVQQFDMAAMQAGQFRMLSFADLAYDPNQPLYSPEEARSSEPDVTYLYFRTAEEKPADVTLKDVRDEVVRFWKQRKAFELALADAKRLADKAKSASALAEVVPDAAQIITPPPFAWMTTGGFGFGQPELSQVTGIELAGREFMEAVFRLRPGEAGAAPNQSRQRVYVVRVINQEPDDESLRAQFLESGYNNMMLMLAQAETLQTQFEWYRGLADSYDVKWERPPMDEQRL